MTWFDQFLIARLQPHLPASTAELRAWLTPPPDPSMGDLALPCFHLAKRLQRPPHEIAQQLVTALGDQSGTPLARVEAVGPYLNVRLSRPEAGAMLLEAALNAGAGWCSSDLGQGQTVCIDFCSPNVARRMHLGHLRSTVIGHALARLHENAGYRVVRINYLGDWGTQFGKLIAAWKRWGDPAATERDPVGELQRVYVAFYHAAKADPALEEEGRLWFRRLEEGDQEARALWGWIREVSLQSLGQTLALLGVTFDDQTGEAFYQQRNRAVVALLAEQGLMKESQGAQVVELDGLPPCLIVKNDGATLYATRDLAAAIHRQEIYQPVRSLYVVDQGQALHFAQVFAVLRRLGIPWSEGLQHVGFGVMRVGGRRLRTRAGEVVLLEEVLSAAIAAARAELDARSPGMAGAEEVARAIGVGAVIFNDLKQNRVSDIDFNPDEAIRFDGETGPYVQYAHARCRSLLRKAGADPQESMVLPHDALADEVTWSLLTAIAALPDELLQAADRCEPHIAARGLLTVAKAFNRFYHDVPVLQAAPEARRTLLALVAVAAQTLKTGLWALGLEAPPMRGD